MDSLYTYSPTLSVTPIIDGAKDSGVQSTDSPSFNQTVGGVNIHPTGNNVTSTTNVSHSWFPSAQAFNFSVASARRMASSKDITGQTGEMYDGPVDQLTSNGVREYSSFDDTNSASGVAASLSFAHALASTRNLHATPMSERGIHDSSILANNRTGNESSQHQRQYQPTSPKLNHDSKQVSIHRNLQLRMPAPPMFLMGNINPQSQSQGGTPNALSPPVEASSAAQLYLGQAALQLHAASTSQTASTSSSSSVSHSRHHSISGAEFIILPSPALESGNVISTPATEVIPTRRLPPRIPPSDYLSRLGSAPPHRNRVHAHSNPVTPVPSRVMPSTLSFTHTAGTISPKAVPPHHALHGTSTFPTSSIAPSLTDLMATPADSSERITFTSWNSLSAAPTPIAVHSRARYSTFPSPGATSSAPATPHSCLNQLSHALNFPSARVGDTSQQHPSAADIAAAAPLSPEWRSLLSRVDNIEHVRADPSVHTLLSHGVPPAARPALWMLLSGANEERRRFPSNYYRNLLIKHKLNGSTYDDEIRRDVTRTLPSLPLFNPRTQPTSDSSHAPLNTAKTAASGASSMPVPSDTVPPTDSSPGVGEIYHPTGSGGLARLQRVLVAYAIRSPSLGYCQGMNLLAAVALTQLPSEEEAFWLLTCLIEGRIGYYAKSMAGLETDQRVFSSLISYFLPRLADHLKEYNVLLASFTVSWFVCLWVESPLGRLTKEVYPLWDQLLLRGDELLFGFSLALLARKEKEIRKLKEHGEIMNYVLHSGFKTKIHSHHTNDETADGSISVDVDGAPSSSISISGDNSNSTQGNELDIYSMLSNEVPRMGTLSTAINALREHHRSEVIAKSRILNAHAASRLAAQFKFPSADSIQLLWEQFLSPSPWSILLHGSLSSPVRLLAALTAANIFPATVLCEWRDVGLLSGFISRLFDVVDSECMGEIRFEQFLATVHIMRYGGEEERTRFLFRIIDVDMDGYLKRNELKHFLRMMHLTFSGGKLPSRESDPTPLLNDPSNSLSLNILSALTDLPPPLDMRDGFPVAEESDAHTVSELFTSMIFTKAAEAHRMTLLAAAEKQAEKERNAGAFASAAATLATVIPLSQVQSILENKGLGYRDFRQVIALHPFTRLTFSLSLPDSRTNASRSSNVTGGRTVPASTSPVGTVIPTASVNSSSTASSGAATPHLPPARSISVPLTSAVNGSVPPALLQSSASSVNGSGSSMSLLASIDRSTSPALHVSSGVGGAAGVSSVGAVAAAAASGSTIRSRHNSLNLGMSGINIAQLLAPAIAPAPLNIAATPNSVAQ
jgi:hypothetical protein